MMSSGIVGIYNTGNPSSDYHNLFILRDYSACTEVLFWKKFSTALSINNQRNYKLEVPFGSSLTKELADSYLCTDGKPISSSPLFEGYNTITDEMKNRDPRFNQTIFAPANPWQVADNTLYWSDVYSNLNTASNYYAPTGYVQRKDYDPVMTYHSTILKKILSFISGMPKCC